MKRLLLVLIILCVVVAAVTAAAVAGMGGPPAKTGAAGAAGAAADSRQNCNFVLAGNDATADGSVMMAYNNDWSDNNAIWLQVVPATATTYRYTRIISVGGVQEGGINQHAFSANYGAFTDLDPAVLAADPYVKKGYGGDVWDLMLSQCTTCDEALDLMASIAATKGFSSGAAGSWGIADADETWVIELLGGRHWVAQRVPDNAVLAHPNILVVQEVDLSDTADFRGSPDLQSFAESIGRYSPADGPFNVSWAYGDRSTLETYYDSNRLWGVYDSVAPSAGVEPDTPFANRPVYVVPDDPVTRQDLMAIDRYHYEGTALDQTGGYALMSPHDQTNRPICCSYTDYGAVWQIRDWLPDEVAGVMWVAPSRPCSSAFVPFYAGITAVPDAWTSRTAFSAFRKVAERLDKNGSAGGENYYKHYISLVQSVYGGFETETANAQTATEATAAGLTGSAREAYLTSYSGQRATQAYELARSLPAQMP